MKKYLSILIILITAFSAFAQEEQAAAKPALNLTFSEGASFAQLTRIEKLDDRSNFVRENFLVGAFFNMKTDNFWLLDFTLQFDAYYPFYNAFNGMRQFPKNAILYAMDGYLGAVYHINLIKALPIDVSVGMHYMYQLTDEYHMHYIGLGTLNTIKFPITERWTLVNNYFFSYDDANIGSNKSIQSFDASYQYHIDLGVRYSKKVLNPYHYVNIQPKAEKSDSTDFNESSESAETSDTTETAE